MCFAQVSCSPYGISVTDNETEIAEWHRWTDGVNEIEAGMVGFHATGELLVMKKKEAYELEKVHWDVCFVGWACLLFIVDIATMKHETYIQMVYISTHGYIDSEIARSTRIILSTTSV